MTGSDDNYMNPGAIIDHDVTLHMYAYVFTAWPGPVDVYHLTWSDGIEWELAGDEPIMTSSDVPFTAGGQDVSSGFFTDDGTWVLVFTTVSGQPWEIGLATGPGPDRPWTVLPEPVLVGQSDAREDGGLGWPSVVPTEDGWAMYFTAKTGIRRAERSTWQPLTTASTGRGRTAPCSKSNPTGN